MTSYAKTSVFDLLVAALIVVPLLSGGVILRGVHWMFEWSELGPLVAAVALAAVVFKKVLGIPLENSRSANLLVRAWSRWSIWLATRPKRTLAAGAAGSALLLSARSLRRHAAYQSASFDLGIFTQAVWNAVHGHGYVSALKGGANLLGDHQSYLLPGLLVVFAPLFRYLPLPESLLTLQAIGLAAGGAAVYFLAKPYLERKHADLLAAVPLLYWAYLPFRNAAAYDFHPEIFIAPLSLAGIAGLQSRRARSRILGALALFAAMLSKESGGPVAVGIAAAWLAGAAPDSEGDSARRFTRRFALLLLPLGIALFFFDVRVVPKLLGVDYAYRANYAEYGPGLKDVFLSPILQPGVFFEHLGGKARLNFLFWTLGPLGFLPFLGPAALLSTLPAYLMLFLSDGDARINILFHYGIECSVGLFWALPLGLARAGRFFPSGKILLWLLFWGLAAFGRSELFYIRENSPTPHERWLSESFVPCVDPAVSLSASGHLVPHLATREWTTHLPELGGPAGTPVACAIEDDQIGNWPMTGEQWLALRVGALDRNYRLTFRCGTLKLYSHNEESCLRCLPPCPDPAAP